MLYFCDRRAKELQVLKYYFCENICSVLDRKVRGSGILVEANLVLAIWLQSDLIVRAVLYVASILRSKSKLK